MSLARRMGPAGLRRAGGAPAILPWKGFETDNVLALDAYLGITQNVGVNLWSDQSAQGNDFTQGVSSDKEPAYGTYNTRPVVDFDGTDDYLRNTTFSGVTAGDEFTIFCVCRWKNITPDGGPFETTGTASTSDQGIWLFNFSSGANLDVYNGPAGGRHLVISGANNTDMNVIAITATPTLTTLYRNGTSLASANTPTVSMLDIIEMVLGARANVSTYSPIQISSLLWWSTSLSSGDRDIITRRLGARWGVAVS